MTDEQRDNLLLSMYEALNNLDAKFEKKIDNLDTKFERKIDNLDKKFEQKFEIYRQENSEWNQKFMQELERLRLNMVKLENNLTDQIRTLFDFNQTNEDKLKDHDAKLEEIDKTLDWHHSRIFKLEATH